MRLHSLPIIVILCSMPFVTLAEAISLLGGDAIAPTRIALFTREREREAQSVPSLFVGRAETGFFAVTRRTEAPRDKPASHFEPGTHRAVTTLYRGSDVDLIRNLIGQAESRRDGYDAVQHGARIKPKKLPSRMTLAEVFEWIEDTPGQPHAIGRYQFIPKTLRRVVAKLGVPHDQVFTTKMQDRLADVLLAEAGLNRFRNGGLDRTAFMNNLAKIWAGLPNSTGKSHYDGYAGNKASMTWARFDAVMAQIEPG